MFEEQIEKIANLARIKIEADEKENLIKSLNEIIEYVNKINDLNLENLTPLFNLLENLQTREDEVLLDDRSDEVLQIINNFPEKENNYLKVPKILDK